MILFQTLYNEFESSRDIAGFTNKYSTNNCSIRFLLMRSLDNHHLIELMTQKGIPHTKGRFEFLLQQLYNSSVSIEDVVTYINSKREEINSQRNEAEEGLRDIITNYGTVNCGLRNDKVDDIVKALVRDKTIKSVDTLRERIEYEIVPKIKNYILWSFYNQTTNDLIEHSFIKHPRVIPTLRKIHDIDFFIKLDDTIIPFDLKITHIAEDFFDLYTKGLLPADENCSDSFYVNSKNKSEIEIIKEFYKNKKRELSLPNYGGLSKNELLNVLENTSDPTAINFVRNIYMQRSNSIKQIAFDLKKLEWWNYKYQGERLFSNNNRFFIFLAYTNAFEDGRPIKGKLAVIENSVKKVLDSINSNCINNIKYCYDKDRSLAGNYSVKSLSILITDTK